MTTPRKHHFVPRFYLRGFTPSGTKKEKLFVFDKTTAEQWQANPNDAACERDFYILEVEEDEDPMLLERGLSEIEEAAADALRYVQSNRRLPTGDALEGLITFIALMDVRVPGSISSLAEPFEHMGRMMLSLMTQTKERWESVIARMKAGGREVEDVSWEKMREFVKGDRCQVRMTQNFKMSTLMEKLNVRAPLLASRAWALVEAPDSGPYFICSDRPQGCSRAADLFRLYGPEFGMSETLATFPLSKDLALLGTFESEPPPRLLEGRAVAAINASTAFGAQRFLYSGTPEFSWLCADGTIGGLDELRLMCNQNTREDEEA